MSFVKYLLVISNEINLNVRFSIKGEKTKTIYYIKYIIIL